MKRIGLCIFFAALTGCALPDPAYRGDVAPCPNTPWTPPCPEVKIRCLPEEVCDSSETPLNVSTLLDIALKNNPLTSTAWYAALTAAYNVGVAKSFLYPTLTGEVEFLHVKTDEESDGTVSTTNILPNTTNAVIENLTLTYLLFDFGGRNANVQAAKQALMALDWTHNQVIQDVMISVYDSYFAHLAAKALVKATEENLKDTKVTLDAAEKQFYAGVVTKVDVLQARSQVANAQLQLALAQGDVKITHSQLAKAIGWLPKTCFEVAPLPEEVMKESIPCGVETLMATAEARRADLKAFYHRYLQAKEQIIIARSAGLPTVNVELEAVKTHFINASSFDTTIYTGQASLNIPIFSGFLYRYQTASAAANAATTFYQWKDKEANVFLEVLISYYNYTTSVETVHFSKEFLKFTQEAYEATLLGYREGTQNIVDLLSAQSALERARAEWIRARLQFVTSIAQVAYSTGTL